VIKPTDIQKATVIPSNTIRLSVNNAPQKSNRLKFAMFIVFFKYAAKASAIVMVTANAKMAFLLWSYSGAGNVLTISGLGN
jgi:hypothetical protein